MSLRSPASPRAAEPKTRTLCAPCFAAMRKISSRFSRRRCSTLMAQLLQGSWWALA